MDPLSEVLGSLRLTGGVFLDSRFTAPWSILAQLSAEDCNLNPETPGQMIAYHVIVSGRLFVAIGDEPAIEVGAGEVVLLPRNDPHRLASKPGLAPVNANTLVQPSPDGGLASIIHGGGGELTHVVCGFLATENLHNPLIATLPRLLRLDLRESAARDWVEASVRFAARELTQGKFASSSVMSRLSESLLVEAVRNYSSTLGEQETGWLKGLADPHIGRALALIHHNARTAWSTEALARDIGLSRSAFVERFTALVGMPPIRYLTAWRLQTARLTLRETRMPIAQLAHSVGYESEEAFSRAFKREFGMPPARWRRGQA
ncbi:MAG: AraC family transcriptional regulator [Pseudolabrys sp.]|nr:AraC family transcriptional regulator [Pseudolabrys sp.]